MEAIDAADSLDTLNAMLAEWHAAGIGLPDYSIGTLETELATDAADKEAIAYSLALRLAPEYGIQLPAEFGAVAESAMGRMRLRYFQPGEATNDLPTDTACFDIETGE
jgi:hypothetical protein